MAIDNQFGKGIGVAAGFDLGAQKPLDARIAVNTIAERDAHVENNRAYEGMIVFVDETKKNYQLVNGEWVELLKAEQDRLAALEAMLNGEGAEGGALDALQDSIDAVNDRLEEGGDIENRISQNESDIDALQGLVGQPVQAGEGEEGDIPATGLHLALDNAKAELEQAILDEKGRAEEKEAELLAAIGQASVEADEAQGIEAKEATGLHKVIEDAINAEIDAREDAEAELDRRLDVIEGEGEGSIKKAVADLKAIHDGEMDAVEGRVEALENLHKGENSIENQIANAKQEALDAVEDEKDRAEGKEAELLQAINKEIEDRGNAVQGLADRHDQEMEAAANKVAEDLAALKLELQGEIDGDVAAEAKLRDDADKALDERVKPLEAHVAAQPGVDAEQDRRIKALEDDAPVKQAAIEAAQKAADDAQDAADAAQADVDAIEKRLDDEGGLVDRIEANETNIARLDGAVDVEGSVKKQIKDAVDVVNADAEALEARVKVNEDALAIVNGAENVEGSIAKAEKDAKDYTDQKIADLIDSAPDAMNTLNELAQAIKDHGDVYKGYVAEHAEAMAQQKADLQAEIDADVKVVADELAKQKDAEQEGTLANQIKVEKARALEQEAAIRQELANEKAALQAEIDADVAAEAALRVAEEAKIRQELADEAAEIRGEMAEQHQAMNEQIAEDHAAMNKALEDEAAAIREEMATEATRVNQKIASDIATESALRVAEEQRIEKALEDEAAAIRGEVEAIVGQHAVEADPENGVEAVVASGLRKEMDDAVAAEKARAEGQEAAIRGEFADADEALHATVKSEMAAVIQSLAVGIVDGKLRVALGGIEGDDVLVIREQEIDFVTDVEIDEIIAGLDAVEGEQ